MIVWKVPLFVADVWAVTMKRGAKILCVQTQGGDQPMLWFSCDPSESDVQRKILIAGTGHFREDIDPDTYVGTFQVADGALVFHVYDGGEFNGA